MNLGIKCVEFTGERGRKVKINIDNYSPSNFDFMYTKKVLKKECFGDWDLLPCALFYMHPNVGFKFMRELDGNLSGVYVYLENDNVLELKDLVNLVFMTAGNDDIVDNKGKVRNYILGNGCFLTLYCNTIQFYIASR